MSIRCGSCKDRHDTVTQVMDCSATKAGQSTCRHDLAPRTCITCASWNKRRGTKTIRSHLAHPPAWLLDLDLFANGTCSICQEIISWNESISVRKGMKMWAHTHCFTDPATANPEEDYRNQREPHPAFNDLYDKVAALERLADTLLPEAVTTEQETTILCLKQVAEDMDYELSIDLIRETIYGYSLDELGAWEPREEEDIALLQEDWAALAQLQAAYGQLE